MFLPHEGRDQMDLSASRLPPLAPADVIAGHGREMPTRQPMFLRALKVSLSHTHMVFKQHRGACVCKQYFWVIFCSVLPNHDESYLLNDHFLSSG